MDTLTRDLLRLVRAQDVASFAKDAFDATAPTVAQIHALDVAQRAETRMREKVEEHLAVLDALAAPGMPLVSDQPLLEEWSLHSWRELGAEHEPLAIYHPVTGDAHCYYCGRPVDDQPGGTFVHLDEDPVDLDDDVTGSL